MVPSSSAFSAYVRASFCVRYRGLTGLVYLDPDALRSLAALVIGYGSGPVRSSHEVGAVCVTAPAPAGRLPAPPLRRKSNRLEWLQIQLFLEDVPRRGVSL